jgi:hypothetical protein
MFFGVVFNPFILQHHFSRCTFVIAKRASGLYQSVMTNSMVEQRRQKFHRRRRRKFKRLFWILLGGLILAGVLGVIIYFLTRPKPPSGFSVPYDSGVQFN